MLRFLGTPASGLGSRSASVKRVGLHGDRSEGLVMVGMGMRGGSRRRYGILGMTNISGDKEAPLGLTRTEGGGE
jgi:hypothetical protein